MDIRKAQEANTKLLFDTLKKPPIKRNFKKWECSPEASYFRYKEWKAKQKK